MCVPYLNGVVFGFVGAATFAWDDWRDGYGLAGFVLGGYGGHGMSRYQRADVPGGSYFFTVVTERRQRILTEPAMRAALRESIETVRATRPFCIDAWVLLPDHLHAIWTLPEGDADFATRWRLIKAGVTRRCGALYAQPHHLTARRAAKGCGTLWQHRYWEHLLRDIGNTCCALIGIFASTWITCTTTR